MYVYRDVEFDGINPLLLDEDLLKARSPSTACGQRQARELPQIVNKTKLARGHRAIIDVASGLNSLATDLKEKGLGKMDELTF